MADDLRVVFAGTPENAAKTLSDLHSAGVNIVGVLTRNDARVGKSKVLSASPVSAMADECGLTTHKSNSMDEATGAWLAELDADLGVVVAYGTIFKADVLSTPRLGWINLHYSLLPELPGPAPVQHALLKGLSSTGVTVFRLDEGVDTGPLVRQKEVGIDQAENSSTLLNKLTAVGSELLKEVVLEGEAAILTATSQPKTEDQPHAYKPTRAHARLDFSLTSSELSNLVRAMNPEPMAWFDSNGINIRVLSARSIDANIPASQAVMLEKELVVGCHQGSLALELVQPSGKNPMSGADWFRGLHVEKLEIS